MIRVLAHCPVPHDATSLMRGFGPLIRLRQHYEIELITTDKFNWVSMQNADVLFMQRPFRPDHIEIMRIAKLNKVPVVLDLDDNLFCVPISNPTHRIYGDETIKKNVAMAINMADHVIVSTEALRQEFQDGQTCLNKNVTVIANGIDDYFHLPPEQSSYKKEPKQKLIMWRGSSTHDADLMQYSPEIIHLARDNPSVTFYFQGHAFWYLYERLPNNCIFGKAIDAMEYFKLLKEVQPTAMQVPLVFDNFNKAKSNIAWLEGTLAGAVSIAPNMPEWVQPGVLTYKTPSEYFNHIQNLIDDKIDCEDEFQKSVSVIKKKYLLSQLNEKRKTVLETVSGKTINYKQA